MNDQNRQEQYLKDMSEIYPNWVPTDISDRKVCVAICPAHHGRPSSAMIEFEGSPSRFPVWLRIPHEGEEWETLIINGHTPTRFSKKRVKALNCILSFLRDCGYLDR